MSGGVWWNQAWGGDGREKKKEVGVRADQQKSVLSLARDLCLRKAAHAQQTHLAQADGPIMVEAKVDGQQGEGEGGKVTGVHWNRASPRRAHGVGPGRDGFGPGGVAGRPGDRG